MRKLSGVIKVLIPIFLLLSGLGYGGYVYYGYAKGRVEYASLLDDYTRPYGENKDTASAADLPAEDAQDKTEDEPMTETTIWKPLAAPLPEDAPEDELPEDDPPEEEPPDVPPESTGAGLSPGAKAAMPTAARAEQRIQIVPMKIRTRSAPGLFSGSFPAGGMTASSPFRFFPPPRTGSISPAPVRRKPTAEKRTKLIRIECRPGSITEFLPAWRV